LNPKFIIYVSSELLLVQAGFGGLTSFEAISSKSLSQSAQVIEETLTVGSSNDLWV